MPPRRHRPQRRRAVSAIPAWLEFGTPERGGSVAERVIAMPPHRPETRQFLSAHGLRDQVFHELYRRYDAFRDAGHTPERALELSLAAFRSAVGPP